MNNNTSFPPSSDDYKNRNSIKSTHEISSSESGDKTERKVTSVSNLQNTEYTKPMFSKNIYYDNSMQANRYLIEELQPQLNEMYDKAVRFNQDYDLSLIAEVQKNIQAYENRLSEKSTWGYITHLFSKIIGIFHTSQEPSKAESAVDLMTNLWHFKLSSDQKKIVEALMKSERGEKGAIDTNGHGFRYIGTFRDGIIGGIPEGKGTITYGSGDYYEGYFLNGLPHGQGEWNYKTNSTNISYRGQFEDGMPHGKGRLVDKNGIIYIGEFQNGKPHGKVQIIYNEQKSDENDQEFGEVYDAYVLCKEGKMIQGIFNSNQSRFIGYLDEDENMYDGILTKHNGEKWEFFEGNKIKYNGTHHNRDGSTLEYRDGLPYEGFLFNNLDEKLEYHQGEPYEGILTAMDGSKKIYINGEVANGQYWDESIDKTDQPREYKEGQPFNGIFAYPNGEKLVYVNGQPYNGILLQLDGKHLTYRDGELLNVTKYYTKSGEKIEYQNGLPFEGTLIKPDGTRIKYNDGEIFNGIDRINNTDLEYRNGRPYQGILLYPDSDFTLEYVNGVPYKGILIKENGDKVVYEPGKKPVHFLIS